MPYHQAAGLEAGQDPGQVAGVDVEQAAELDELRRVALGQLEDDPGLGERVGAVEEPLAEHPDHVGVEAVEAADGGDAIGLDGVGQVGQGAEFFDYVKE